MTGNLGQPIGKYDYFFMLLLGFLLLLRLATVLITPLYIGPDEAQYWRWGQSFDWGYYSKPPIVAWIIGVSTAVFGHEEWAIRIASPVFQTGSALFVYLTARKLWHPLAGLFAGSCWLLMGGVWLSSILMTTDVPLLFFWSAALYALVCLRAGGGLASAIGLGVAIGLGFLSKYAMIYFLIGLAIALVIDRPTRRALLSMNGLLAGLIFLVLFTPHLIWNAEHGFKTVSHTADNANWGDNLFNVEEALDFIGGQLAVFNPILFPLLLVLLITGALTRSEFLKTTPSARLLLAFIVPPLLIITVQAFISRAHANWAASAYPAACVLLAAWTVSTQDWVRRVMIFGLVFNLGFGIVATSVMMLPRDNRPEWVKSAMTKSVRSWPETVEVVNAKVAEHQVSAIIVDDRETWHSLDYYGRDGVIRVPIRSWRRAGYPKSASEETPISAADSENALVLSLRRGLEEKLVADFKDAEKLDDIVIDLGGGRDRVFHVWLVRDFAPLPRGTEATEGN